jgi:hypothetical protein
VDRVLAAAATALGVELTAVEELSRGRSLVLRAWAGDRPVVLKVPLHSGPEQARELAALRVLGGAPGAVPLLAEAGGGTDPPVLVLADLGSGPSMADALLGSDPAVAEAALGAWATALGALQAATTGRRDAFVAELARLSPLGPGRRPAGRPRGRDRRRPPPRVRRPPAAAGPRLPLTLAPVSRWLRR